MGRKPGGGNASRAVRVCKEEQEGDRVTWEEILEVRADPRGGAEALPDAPGGRNQVPQRMQRAVGMEHCCDSAPVTAEVIAGSRCSNLQGIATSSLWINGIKA